KIQHVKLMRRHEKKLAQPFELGDTKTLRPNTAPLINKERIGHSLQYTNVNNELSVKPTRPLTALLPVRKKPSIKEVFEYTSPRETISNLNHVDSKLQN